MDSNKIIETLTRIETKLNEVIKALHEYDDANIEDVNEGYGKSSFEAFQDEYKKIVEKDSNIQDKHTGEDKKRMGGNKKKYYNKKKQ